MGDDELRRTDPSAHYYIGTRTSERYDLPSWLGKNAGDPAFKVHQVTLHCTVLTISRTFVLAFMITSLHDTKVLFGTAMNMASQTQTAGKS